METAGLVDKMKLNSYFHSGVCQSNPVDINYSNRLLISVFSMSWILMQAIVVNIH